MHHSLRRSLLAPLLIGGLACSSGSGLPQGSSGGASTSGGSASGGRSGTAGSGFASSGASGGSSLGGAFENGGTVGSGGVAGIGSGGVAGIGSGAAGSGEGGAIAGPGGQAGMSSGGQATAGAGAIGDLDELYEAEAIPPNQIFGFAQNTKCTPMCTKPLTVGANCCSGSGQVTWIVSENGAHPAGWMQFNAISAPANASYDVTFWYHCGLSDTYGDGNCGGQAMTEPKQTGCRPHVFTVNGTVLPGGYHFPCFPGSWNTIYAATVSLPLAAGMNTIKVAAPPPRDAVDVDAIEILPPGKGHAPLIAANTDLLGENN